MTPPLGIRIASGLSFVLIGQGFAFFGLTAGSLVHTYTWRVATKRAQEREGIGGTLTIASEPTTCEAAHRRQVSPPVAFDDV